MVVWVFSSAFSFTNEILSPYSPASSSMIGESCLQGAHHSAQ